MRRLDNPAAFLREAAQWFFLEPTPERLKRLASCAFNYGLSIEKENVAQKIRAGGKNG